MGDYDRRLATQYFVHVCVVSVMLLFVCVHDHFLYIMMQVFLEQIQCIIAYPNPFGSLAQNFVQISETAFIMYIQYNLKRKIFLISVITFL